jgi:hypothetical protein
LVTARISKPPLAGANVRIGASGHHVDLSTNTFAECAGTQ